MSGTLFVIGTPLGNREDITIRAIKTLFSVDLLLCEDTRQTSKLLEMVKASRFTLHANDTSELRSPKLERFDENVERIKTRQVIGWLTRGRNIGLVTDAGMPGISDPGTYLIGKCHEAGIRVEVIPGPSALTTAVAMAGFLAPSVTFLGFLPKKMSKRQKLYEDLRFSIDDLRATSLVVLYESPYRLRQTLEEINHHFGEVQVAAMSELTKMHEKIIRGNVREVLNQLPEAIKGEWVVVCLLSHV